MFVIKSILSIKVFYMLLFLFTNICIGQSESRKAFVLALNVPDNERNSNSAFKEIASENNLKRLSCFQDNKLQSDLYFDKLGNVILNFDTSNRIISKSEFKYDSKDRLSEISYFDLNGEFTDGFRYEYDGLYKTKFETGNAIPIDREVELKEENIRIYSRYTSDGWVLSGIYIKNSKGEYERELNYNNDGLYKEFQHYYDSKLLKGFTKKITYSGGLKISEKDYSAYKTDVRGNKIERYSAYSNDTLQLVSTHKFNEQNQVIENDYPSFLENFEYYPNGLIKSKTTKNRNGITVLTFFYQNLLPKKIVKNNGENESTFRYEYEFFK
ncbi:hypothetical protein POV26_05820 [Aequorivita todarodis]|uniref:hypothetical protein n=1 Tax=Aequorivita todarodis TaxID=2036821 RepID=UPI002350A676|nr:hypothetical protein [Aequorivita todarodis]MDC8000544.1 hypothetical protein [Aequorivita todarodis]